MQSVSSNAVANAVNVIQTQVNQKADAPKDYFNANTDRTVTNNRINAIKTFIPRTQGGWVIYYTLLLWLLLCLYLYI